MLDSDKPSLSSLLSDGIVADLIKEIFLLGPCDMLRLSLSSLKTRCNDRPSRGTGIGRLVAAPGRAALPEKLEGLGSLGLLFEAGTGPPSLRLIAAHRSGSRAEKLLKVLEGHHTIRRHQNLQGNNDLDTKVSRYIICCL